MLSRVWPALANGALGYFHFATTNSTSASMSVHAPLWEMEWLGPFLNVPGPRLPERLCDVAPTPADLSSFPHCTGLGESIQLLLF